MRLFTIHSPLTLLGERLRVGELCSGMDGRGLSLILFVFYNIQHFEGGLDGSFGLVGVEAAGA